jgi:hypothetical protein
MSRNVTSTFRSAAFAQETNQVYLVLLAISHASITTIYVVNNYANIVSNGNTYIGFPFDIELPQDFEEALPSVSLTICNVDRQIVQAVRTLQGAPTITISVVLASSPNTVEAGPYTMTLREVSYDAMAVSGTIMPEDMLNEAYPGDYFTPSNFPGIFA